MELHVLPGSPNCHKVLATARHLDLDINVVEHQLFSPDMKGEAFLSLNPNGKTPVLEDGPLKLWESNAICVYLAEKHSQPHNLFPAPLRPHILQWSFWETTHYNNALGTIAWQTVIKPGLLKQDPDEHAVATATENFNTYARVLNDHMQGRTHIVGEDWTIADYVLGALEKFMEYVPIDFDEFPNIKSYYERLRANPHWADTRLGLDALTNAA